MVDSVQVDTFRELGLLQEPSAQKPKDELGRDTFLKLMVAQLQNQDPMSPMENGEFLTQIAQFGTVEGIRDLKDSFKGLASSLQSNQVLQASGLVGRTVLANSSQAHLGADSPLSGSVNLESGAGDVKVRIISKAGETVHTLNLGAQPAGNISFSWDGVFADGTTASPGAYEVRAETTVFGETVALETWVASEVESVTLGNNGLVLNRAGLGDLNFNDVKQVR